jgi:hypothetical protein
VVKSIVRNDTKNRRRRRRQRGCRCRCHCSSGCGSSAMREHCELPSPACSEEQSQQDYSTPSTVAPSATASSSSLSSSYHGSSEALIEAIESPLRALVGDSVWVVACHYTELYSRKYVQSRVTTITADKDSAGVDRRQQNDDFPNSNDDDARR